MGAYPGCSHILGEKKARSSEHKGSFALKTPSFELPASGCQRRDALLGRLDGGLGRFRSVGGAFDADRLQVGHS